MPGEGAEETTMVPGVELTTMVDADASAFTTMVPAAVLLVESAFAPVYAVQIHTYTNRITEDGYEQENVRKRTVCCV